MALTKSAMLMLVDVCLEDESVLVVINGSGCNLSGNSLKALEYKHSEASQVDC